MHCIIWTPPSPLIELHCTYCSSRIVSSSLIGIDEYNIKLLYQNMSCTVLCFRCVVGNAISDSSGIKTQIIKIIEDAIVNMATMSNNPTIPTIASAIKRIIQQAIENDSAMQSSIKMVLQQWIKEESCDPNGTFRPAS